MVKNRFSMIDDLTNDHTGSSKKFSDPFNFANVDVSDVRKFCSKSIYSAWLLTLQISFI